MQRTSHQYHSTQAPGAARLAAALFFGLVLAGAGHAQRIKSDEPTAYQEPTTTHTVKQHGTFYNVCSAICWYIPNRVLDFIDIPKLSLSAGDGNGIQLRATKLLDMTWINNDANAIGIENRAAVGFFGISRDDKHFGFLAAQQGDCTGDPTEIGIAGHLIVLGGHFGVSLSAGLDFLTGIIGIDLEGDDHGPTWVDYTPQPEFKAGKNPVPDAPLQPESTVPNPVPVTPITDEGTTGTLSPATIPVISSTSGTYSMDEVHTSDKTVPALPKP